MSLDPRSTFQTTVSLSCARPRSRSPRQRGRVTRRAQRLKQLVDAVEIGLAVDDLAAELAENTERAALQTAVTAGSTG